jgi:hypothetical protein
MNLKGLETSIIVAISNLSVDALTVLAPYALYSSLDKAQFIEEIQRDILKVREFGIDTLIVKESSCKFCFPSANSFSFHHSRTNELIIRYVILKEDEKRYIVQECRNKWFLKEKSGLPF